MILSVVIPTRDKHALLARTLDALGKQEGVGEPWEVVVVNDGSSDGTARLLAELAGEPGSRLKVVDDGRATGRAGARQRGWRAAAGRWVLFLDDDILAPAGLLAAHLRILRENPRCGTIGRVVTEPVLVDAPHFHYLDSRGVAKVKRGFVPARYFVTQNAAVPREALEAVGGFDTRFLGWGLEDMELGFRLEDLAGLRFLAVTEPLPRHAHHHTLAQLLAKKRECGAGSLPLLADRHPGRVREMRLHWVIDAPAGARPPWSVRLARRAAQGWPAACLEALLARWPAARGGPLCPGLYARGMDILMLCAYRQGLARGLTLS